MYNYSTVVQLTDSALIINSPTTLQYFFIHALELTEYFLLQATLAMEINSMKLDNMNNVTEDNLPVSYILFYLKGQPAGKLHSFLFKGKT